MKPDKTLVVDISRYDGKDTYPERFPGASVVDDFPTEDQLRDWLKDLDVVIAMEIPYNYKAFEVARERGIKTVLQHNYEFLDYLQDKNLPMPDLFLAPSLWHFRETKELLGEDKVKKLEFPVNRDLLKFELKDQCKKFVHIAGYELYQDRNGTQALLDAIQYVTSDVEFVIYSQHQIPGLDDPRVEIRHANVKNYTDLTKDGDVLILPRRYGGQSLQMNEALSRGMLVLMPDMPPQDQILPAETLFKHVGTFPIMTRTMIDCAVIDPKVLANKIDEMASWGKEEVMRLSEFSDRRAEDISWKTLKPKYDQVFEELANG